MDEYGDAFVHTINQLIPDELYDSHPEYFPVRVNTSDREALLKVPGIGPETASRILKGRRERKISRLEDLGLKGKRLEKIKSRVVFE